MYKVETMNKLKANFACIDSAEALFAQAQKQSVAGRGNE
jgi:hypothetical protein